MSFLALVGVVILFIWHSNLVERIEKLESLLRQKNKQNTETESINTSAAFQATPITGDESTSTSEPTTPEPTKESYTPQRNPVHFETPSPESTQNFAAKPESITPAEAPTKEFHLEDFFGKKLFAILGATSVVLAIGFFTVWAFSTGAISPVGRIIIGFAFSIGLLLFGEFLREKYPTFFDKITATGLGGMLITAYLARNYDFEDIDYQVLSASSAFFIYAVTAFLGAAFSLRYNARFLGVFSILAGVIMPLWVNSDPNPVGLFSYLSIFSVAGVALALHKKWSEISVILFVAIIGYATGIFYLSAETCAPGPNCFAPWIGISPILFLVFTYGLLYLLGSAGIIRHLRDQSVQTFKKISNTDTTEIILFISALFIANGLGWAVFENQSWPYFGYFVLAQGIIFWFISRAFAAHKLPIFEQIAVGAASFALIFATLLEVGVAQNFMLTLILLAEGILLSFASQKTNQILFNVASKILFVLAFIFVLTIDGFANQSIAMILAATAYLFSTTEPKNSWSQAWSVIVIAKITTLIFTWSFQMLPEVSNIRIFSFIVPTLWAFGLSLSVAKNKEPLYRTAGLIVLTLVSITTWNELLNENFFESFILFAINIAANFGLLYTFFIQEKGVPNNTATQMSATVAVLTFTTLSVLIFGSEFLIEPIRTVAWIAWGGLLFGAGAKQDWKYFRYFGIGVLLLIVAKLYLVDIWTLSVVMRFVAFLALGGALLGVSFIYNKKLK